jgi:predicted permease
MTTPRTPVLARFVIGHRVPRALRENVLGDLEEEFTALAAQHGVRAARRWYRQQVMRSLFAGWPRGAAAGHVHGPGGAVGVLDAASRDLRGAIRSTTRHPRFSVIVVGTLALGIGATTAVFSLANWLLFQPVPGVAVPSRIATVWFGRDSDGGGITVSSLTYPNHTDLTPTLTALHGFAGHQLGSAAVATGDGIPDQRAVGFVMHDYFDVLGVPMQLGRAFLPAEDDYTSGGAYVAVVSDRLWRAMLHADEHAIGKTLLVNGVRVEVIGVAHPGFHGVERLDETDVWMPGVLSPMVNHFPAEFRTYDRERGGYYEYVGRLADGATFDQLRQQLAVGLERLAEAYPTENEKFTVVTAHVFDGAGLPPLGRIALVPTIRLLMGIVLLVLLIACANVANLLLFRGIRRESENAMRRALGASPLRIAREQLVESGVLALVGAVAGVAVAFGLMRLFHGATIAGTGRPIEALTVDWRVLGFTLLAALVSAVVFGIVPAVLQGRVDLAEPLKATARVAGGRTTSRSRSRCSWARCSSYGPSWASPTWISDSIRTVW